ncbi:cellulase family glycosylhydrolase [Streptomyces sp. NPDC001617]
MLALAGCPGSTTSTGGAATTSTAAPSNPASSTTAEFKGVNWADTRDNYNSGWVIPDGLDASDSYAQVYWIANAFMKAFQANPGANTVRLPINPPSVGQSWWNAYHAAIDAALADDMKVIISAWTESKNVGTITDMSAWQSMWNTVVNAYGGNPNVYFEPLNEPYDYKLGDWVSICSTWLSDHANIPRGRVIISGTKYNDNVTGVGAASALDGTLLSLHYYGYWNSYTQESQWQSDLSGRIGGYGGRTIIDEFGAPMTTGIDYLADHNGGQYQSYLAAVTDTARSERIGSVYWPGLKTGDDTYTLETHNGSGLSSTNSSGVTQVRWGWGFNPQPTPTPTPTATASSSAATGNAPTATTPSSASSTTTSATPSRSATPGYDTPQDAVDGFYQGELAGDWPATCSYITPASQSICLASTTGQPAATGTVTVVGAVIQGTEALVEVTGNICAPSSPCVANADPSSGMPSSPSDFATVYQAAVAGSVTGSTTMSPMPCSEVGGKWYVTLA